MHDTYIVREQIIDVVGVGAIPEQPFWDRLTFYDLTIPVT